LLPASHSLASHLLELLEARVAPAAGVFGSYSGFEASEYSNEDVAPLQVAALSLDPTLPAFTLQASGKLTGVDFLGYVSADRSVLVGHEPSGGPFEFGITTAAADLTLLSGSQRLAFLKGEFNGAGVNDLDQGISGDNDSYAVDIKLVFDGLGKATLTYDAGVDGKATTTGTYTVGASGKVDIDFEKVGPLALKMRFDAHVSYDGMKLAIGHLPGQAGATNASSQAAGLLVKTGALMASSQMPLGAVYQGLAPVSETDGLGNYQEALYEVRLTFTDSTQFALQYDVAGNNFAGATSTVGTYTMTAAGLVAFKGTGLLISSLDLSADLETAVGVNLYATATDRDSAGVLLVRSHDSPGEITATKATSIRLDTGGTMTVTPSLATARITLADQTVTLGGDSVTFTPIQFGRVEQIEITPTGSTGGLAVTLAAGTAATVIDRVATPDNGLAYHLNSISLGKGVTLGDGVDDSTPDLFLSGSLKTLLLDGVADHTILRLAQYLVENDPLSTLDSLGSKPAVTLGVVGTDVFLDAGDTIPGGYGGTGGSGLGSVSATSWGADARITTLQSMGLLTLKSGGFDGLLEVDRHADGVGTADFAGITALSGEISGLIAVEGKLTALKSAGFNSVVGAGALGSVTVAASTAAPSASLELGGDFTIGAGLATTFTSAGGFSARVDAVGVIGAITAKTQFTGALSAGTSIGALTAGSFDGFVLDDSVDGFGVLASPTHRNIQSGPGGIGLIKTTAGGIAYYDVGTDGVLAGLTVAQTGITGSAFGVGESYFGAARIGAVTVNLAGKTGVAAVGTSMEGISGSIFDAVGDALKPAAIGPVTVTLNTPILQGAMNGITGSQFTVGGLHAGESLGLVKVSLTTLQSQSALMQGIADTTIASEGVLGGVNVAIQAGTGLGARVFGITSSLIQAEGAVGSSSATLTGKGAFVAAMAWDTVSLSSLNGSLAAVSASVTGMSATLTLGFFQSVISAASIGTFTSTLVAPGGVDIGNAVEASRVTASDNSIKLGTLGNLTAKVDIGTSTGSAAGWLNSIAEAEGSIGTVTIQASAQQANASLVGFKDSFMNANGGTLGAITITASNKATSAGSGGSVAVFYADNAPISGFDAGFYSKGNMGLVRLTASGGASINQAVVGTLDNSPVTLVSLEGSVAGITLSSTRSVAPGSQAQVANQLFVSAGKDIGAVRLEGTLTGPAGDELVVFAGGKIASLTVTTLGIKTFASLSNSFIQAGTNAFVTNAAGLTATSLGAVTLGGTLSNSVVLAQGNIGAVKVDGNMTGTLVLAGVGNGNNGVFGGGDDRYIRHVSVASLTVGGSFSGSTVVAGINPGSDGVWGNDVGVGALDTIGESLVGVATAGRIGAVTLGASNGTVLGLGVTPASGFAIEAERLTSLKIGTTTYNTSDITTKVGLIDLNNNFILEGSEPVIRQVTASG
jgi:hypothetical protein